MGVRGPEPVLAEMIHLRDEYGAREIFFADDLFLLCKKDILEFCRACAVRKPGIEWIGQMRANQVDQAVGEAMARAGCRRVYFGVESGSDTILANARKGITRAQISLGVLAAKQAGLRVKTGWIYGLPGSLDDQYASIPFMLDLRPHEILIHQLIPFPAPSITATPPASASASPTPRHSRASATAVWTEISALTISAIPNWPSCSKTQPRRSKAPATSAVTTPGRIRSSSIPPRSTNTR